MEFTTKAQTLAALAGKLKFAAILPLQIIEGGDFFCDGNKAVAVLQQAFPAQRLIIRSSASNEDTYRESAAGRYLSVLDVDSADSTALQKAIESVYASYDREPIREEVLVQPMLGDVKLSGVAFTCDINTGAPYYIINYATGTDTRSVTGSGTQKLQTFVAYKRSWESLNDELMKAVIMALRELEALFNCEQLDVEFGITKTGAVYLFQVRPMTNRKECLADIPLDVPLSLLYKKIEKLMRPHPFCQGDTTCFGIMPDWNPAEILGVRPKKLAISLYKELVTDNIWAHQRNNYGYKDLVLHPLMVSFCGIPYIDVRISFNSFIPASLHPQIADKLVNYYINRFKDCPMYHDKVEFEIVYSCYYFGLPQHITELTQYGFTDNEIKRLEFSLLSLTNNIINPKSSLFKRDISLVNQLIENHGKIMNSDISIIDKIYWLIEECKSFGTLPFAGAARAGFIAVQFLRSFVERGICTDDEYNAFMSSLNTISKRLSTDRYALALGELSKDEFLARYGHIRPDTYNILSPRYDEAFQRYFGEVEGDKLPRAGGRNFSFSVAQMERIEYECNQNGLLLTAGELIEFIREAIEGREYVKYIFTRSVSEILNLIKQLGRRLNITDEDMAHLDIGQLKQLYVDMYYDNLRGVLGENIAMNKRQYECAVMLKLPSVILMPDDVYSFHLLEDEPNFITTKTVTGETIDGDEILTTDIKDKIVFIPSADPGYDFLFTKQIAGLVTEYGGANSHMAIRCAEMGIPAVIGAGEKNYSRWRLLPKINIDCLNHIINSIEY